MFLPVVNIIITKATCVTHWCSYCCFMGCFVWFGVSGAGFLHLIGADAGSRFPSTANFRQSHAT